jgi:hypothetical protein
MARLIARRTVTLSKGGRFTFMITLSLPFWPVSLTTSEGTFFFAVSAMAFVISRGTATSSRPAWSAARRVPRSVMTG